MECGDPNPCGGRGTLQLLVDRFFCTIVLHSDSFAAMISLSSVSSPLSFSLLPSSAASTKTLRCRHLSSRQSPFRVSALTSSSPAASSHGSVPCDGASAGSVFGLELQRDASSLWDSYSPLSVAPPQTPANAMRGAESDVMGLLLRERIVFLGSSIDDFVADAIISQLLLLDAQDPTRDIRLFINSPGGSLRFDSHSSAVNWLSLNNLSN